MKISELEKIYEEHNSLINDINEYIITNELDNEFPIFNEVCTESSQILERLFKSMCLIASQGDIFSAQIIYRSILELNFLMLYLVGQIVNEKSDQSAEHYKVHLSLSEWLAEQMGYLEMEDLKNEVDNKTNFVQFIADKFPSLKEFDKDNQKEISRAISKFNFRSIIKYLSTEAFSNKQVGIPFSKLLPEYSRTSSFVHGGPYAILLVKGFEEKGELNQELERILGIALICICSVKENKLFSYHFNPDALFLQKLQNIRSKIK